MEQRFKIVLIGDGGVGKTAFIKRHATNIFDRKYVATVGADVTVLSFDSTHGKIVFEVWDTAGQEKFSGMKDGYYVNSNSVIVMFEAGSRITRLNLHKWIDMYRIIAPDTPVIVCGTKIDIQRAQASEKPNVNCDMYYEISTKNNHNCKSPFLWLARNLTGQHNLELMF